jgi:small subunit ribosomal protein S15
MATAVDSKEQIIAIHARTADDTGSPEVQVALLTERIKRITTHMVEHAKDFHSRRGLLMLVSRRKRLLKYLKNISQSRYFDLIKKL